MRMITPNSLTDPTSIALAVAAMRDGRPREAARMLERLIAIGSDDAQTMRLCGTAHAAAGSFEKAEGWLREALKHNPHDMIGNCNLAAVLFRRGDPGAATRALEWALLRSGRDQALLVYAADLCAAGGDVDKAIHYRTQICNMADAPENSQVLLASHLAAAGRMEEAGVQLSGLSSGLPTDLRGIHAVITPLMGVGETEKAEQLLRFVLATRPDDADAHFNLGVLLLNQRRPLDALAAFDGALARDGLHADAWYNRGIVLLSLRRMRAAYRSFESALEAEPGHADARRKLESLWHYHFGFRFVDSLAEGGNLEPIVRQLVLKVTETGWIDEMFGFLISVGLIGPLLELQATLSVEGKLDAPHLWRQFARVLKAQHDAAAHLQYEIDSYGHIDFRKFDGLSSKFLTYLDVHPESVLKEAQSMLDAAEMLDFQADRQGIGEACRIALKLGNQDDLQRRIEAYRDRIGHADPELVNIFAFSLFVRGQERAAQLLMAINQDGYQRVFAKYAAAVDVAVESKPLSEEDVPADGSRTIEVPIRIVKDGGVFNVPTKMELPSGKWSNIRNVYLLNDHGTLMTEDGKLISDTINCDPGRYIYSWPNVQYSYLDRAMVCFPKDFHRIGEPVVIAAYSRDQGNYAHWMLDVLPRILIAETTPELRDHLIVVTADLTDWQIEALRILGIDTNRIVSTANQMPMFFERAVLPATSQGIYFLPEAVRILRKAFRASGAMSQRPATRRVYAPRKSGFRHILNEGKISEFFLGQGFELASPGEMTIEQQVNLFSETEIFAAPGGSAVTNMLFMPEGGKSLIFGPMSNYGNYFAYLAKILKIDYTGVLGDPVPDYLNTYVGWDYQVSVDDLASAMPLFR